MRKNPDDKWITLVMIIFGGYWIGLTVLVIALAMGWLPQ